MEKERAQVMEKERLLNRGSKSVVIIDDNRINRQAFRAYVYRINPETEVSLYENAKEFLKERTQVFSLADIDLI